MWWLRVTPRSMQKHVIYAMVYFAFERKRMSPQRHLANIVMFAVAQVLALVINQ
jgi:hypothetical protein